MNKSACSALLLLFGLRRRKNLYKALGSQRARVAILFATDRHPSVLACACLRLLCAVRLRSWVSVPSQQLCANQPLVTRACLVAYTVDMCAVSLCSAPQTHSLCHVCITT